jgi:hypothetical protein
MGKYADKVAKTDAMQTARNMRSTIRSEPVSEWPSDRISERWKAWMATGMEADDPLFVEKTQ